MYEYASQITKLVEYGTSADDVLSGRTQLHSCHEHNQDERRRSRWASGTVDIAQRGTSVSASPDYSRVVPTSGESMPQRLTGVAGGEMELKAGGELAEASADFDQAQA
jgi:hypothetical protein